MANNTERAPDVQAPDRDAAGIAPPVDRDAYIDGLSSAQWDDLLERLNRWARKQGFPPGEIDDLVSATYKHEIDPTTRTYRPERSATFFDHLTWVMKSQWKNERNLAANRNVPFPDDDGRAEHESRDATGLSPEKHAVGSDLAIKAITLLFQATPPGSVERRILEARAEGIQKPRHLAEKLDLPKKEIEAALKRLLRKEEEVIKDLHFESRKQMFAGAAPPGVERLFTELPPTQNGAAWTRLFVAAYLASAGAGMAWVMSGSSALLATSLASFALLPVFWVAWFHASWRSFFPHWRSLASGRVVTTREVVFPLFIPGYNVYWFFVAVHGLEESLRSTGPTYRAPRSLLRAAAWLTVSPAFLLAPVVWFFAMRVVDSETAARLREWHDWRARRARSD